MAKKVEAYIKLQVPAGQANPSPPVGPALGQHGVNIMEFCKAFNAATQSLEAGLPIPVVISVYSDRSFTYITKTPPASVLLKKAAGITSGSGTPNTKKVGKVTRAQLEEIATTKMPDLTASDMDAAVRTIAGSARAAGIETEGVGVMAKLTKRQKAINEKIEEGKLYSIEDAVALLKDVSSVKFGETVDVAVNLGIDAKKSDQVVRGATTLPHGTGSEVRVAVFAQGANAEKATAAGADLVGMDDLAEQVKAGKLDFDVVIAEPAAMRVVGQLGTILGPRGLMPNPKTGTVTPDVETAVKNAKAGQVRYRIDKNGIIHGAIGKLTFDASALKENLEALIGDLQKAKPSAAKGVYLKKMVLSSTMGPGLALDQSSLEF